MVDSTLGFSMHNYSTHLNEGRVSNDIIEGTTKYKGTLKKYIHRRTISEQT